MLVREIHIEGFKSIVKQTLHLGRVNCLIGANGVGKSKIPSFTVEPPGESGIDMVLRKEMLCFRISISSSSTSMQMWLT